MLTRLKKPILKGFGRRNDTLEALRIERTLKQAADERAARVARARPQALPLAPGQRSLNYIAQTGRRITPAQRRRAEKKGYRFQALVNAGVRKAIEASGWRDPGLSAPAVVDESRGFEG